MFGLQGNLPRTPEEVAQQRAMIAAMMPRYGRAKYVGEGLGQLGMGVVDGIKGARANKAEAEGRASAESLMARITGGARGGPDSLLLGGASSPTMTGGAANDAIVPAVGRSDPMAANGGPTRAVAMPARAPSPQGGGRLQILGGTRAQHSPSTGLNISMDFNASPNGGARGTEVIIPDNASPEVRAAAERFNQLVADFAAQNGITDYPIRGVRTRSENGRGVSNTVHVEPFFNDDRQMKQLIAQNPAAFARLYQEAFGNVDGRLIAPHGVGRDRGAASDIFGDETSYGELMISALQGGGQPMPAGGGQADVRGQQGGDTLTPTMSTQGTGGPALSDLYAAMANPWLNEQERAVIGQMIQQAEQANDPLRQLQIQQAQIQLEQMRNPAPEPGFRLLTPQEVEAAGLPPGSYQAGPDNRIYPMQSGPLVNIEGDEVDPRPEIGTPPAGFQYRYDEAAGGYVAEPIPGSEAAVERQRTQEAQENRERTESIKLGGTLELIDLNLKEIEDGGMAVTGALGDFRRSGLGRALTGSGAVDFGNRTSAITDQAALAEVQNMRDNSPTGGAVGQLTDSERVAIGNSVTALNASTSAEEYARAARRYREAMLDGAYGTGNWTLNPDGSVSLRVQSGDQATGANPALAAPFEGGNVNLETLQPADISRMDLPQLQALQPSLAQMTSEQRRAILNRAMELQNGG